MLYTFSALDSNSHNSDGAASTAPLVLGMDGNFYGTASAGGANGTGTIFMLTPTGVLTTLYSFSALSNGTNSDGATPLAGLLPDGDGNFYGTAEYGGTNGYGALFEWTAAGQFVPLYSFTDADDGAYPDGALIYGDDGNLYGTASQGGTSGAGTIFSYVLHVSDGNAYFQPLYSLNGTSDGKYPVAALLLASNGNFYGTAENGGANGGASGYGTVFKFTYDGANVTFSTIYNLPGIPPGGGFPAAQYPAAPLIQGNDGNLYGTADGDEDGNRAVFGVTTAGVATAAFYSGGGDDVADRSGSVIQGSDGNFYGVMPSDIYLSGNNIVTEPGFVYRIVPGGSEEFLPSIYSFSTETSSGTNSDGGFGQAALIEGNNGTFYGTTSRGGANGTGTIFQFDVAPFLTSPTTATAQVGQPFSYQITAGDSPASYGVSGLSDGLTFNYRTGLISGTPTATGTLKLTVSASNDAGAASQTVTITVNPATPVITSAKTVSGTVGTAFSYQIVASNSPTSYAATNLPPGLSVNTSTGLISGKPTKAGTYQTTVAASNAGGTGLATVTVTINASAPVITSAAKATAQVGVTFSYQITATNSPTSYGVLGLRAGLSVDAKTGLISGKPTGSGTFTLTLKATNAGGTGQESLTLTIKPSSPVITSPATATATVGKAFSYQIKATSSPTSYGVLGLFKGITVNAQAGLISGTPTAAGTHTLTLQATNAGGTGHETLTLTITN